MVLFVGDHDGPKRQVDVGNPTGLLPCLERPYAEVLHQLEARETELTLAPGSLSGIIPLNRIPYAAVASKLDYWVQLGLNWIEVMPPSEVEIELFDTLEHESWPTQQARHRARALRRRRSL
jgi:hypothetical protein